VLLLEHPHTLTVGRRAIVPAILLAVTCWRRGRKCVLNESRRERYLSCLGQIVGIRLLILVRIARRSCFVRDLEEVSDSLASRLRRAGVRMKVDPTHAGGKVGAIGVPHRTVDQTHGFALNVNTDLSLQLHYCLRW